MHLQRRAEQYVLQLSKGRHRLVFSPGDLIWVHVCKERFQYHRRTKLDSGGDDPFEILEAYGVNPYKVELSYSNGVHITFNVANLTPYIVP